MKAKGILFVATLLLCLLTVVVIGLRKPIPDGSRRRRYGLTNQATATGSNVNQNRLNSFIPERSKTSELSQQPAQGIAEYYAELTNSGGTLSDEQAGQKKGLVPLLGVAARTNDDALAFLRAGCDPDWWRLKRQWRRELDDKFVDNELASACIRALGISARTNVEDIILRMRNERSAAYLRRFNGDFVQAKFYLYLASKYRLIAAADAARLGDGAYDEFVRWMSTPEGREWMSWANVSEQRK